MINPIGLFLFGLYAFLGCILMYKILDEFKRFMEDIPTSWVVIGMILSIVLFCWVGF